MDKEQDNIEAQLDMAVEAADDIGFEDVEVDNAEASADETGEVDSVSTEFQSGDEPDSSSSGGNEPVQQETQQSANTDQVATGQNENGDLINAAGEVVASRGAERRVYERSNRIQQENVEMLARMTENQKLLDNQESFANSPAKYGLQNEEALTGMQLMQQLKSDPVVAARQVLQTAVSKGYNIQDIIGTAHGQASPVNMGAIEQMISEKLAPITARENAAQQSQQRQRDNDIAKQKFLSTHQFSEVHLDPITNLLQNNPNISPEQAYYEVKIYAANNDLDFTQPLEPQIRARQAEGNQNANQIPNRGMPNGNSSGSVVTQEPAQASGDDDWDAIVRNSMAESGMQF